MLRIVPRFLAVGSLITLLGCNSGVATKPLPGRALVIVDLSASLSADQRQTIPAMLMKIPAQLPANTEMVVLPLQSDLDNADPLIRFTVPHPANSGGVLDSITYVDAARDTLRARVDSLIKQLPKALDASCYLKTLSFASQFFRASSPNQRQVFWIGDLIEDCPDPVYSPFKITRANTTHPIPSDLKFDSLQITGMLIVRTGNRERNTVESASIRSYWESAVAVAGSNNTLKIGSITFLGY